MGKKSKQIQAPGVSENLQAPNIVRISRVQPKPPKERPISHIRSSVLSWLTDAPSIEEGKSSKPTKPVKKNAPPPPSPIPETPKNSLCVRICLITILVAMILLLIGSIIGIVLAVTLQSTTTTTPPPTTATASTALTTTH